MGRTGAAVNRLEAAEFPSGVVFHPGKSFARQGFRGVLPCLPHPQWPSFTIKDPGLKRPAIVCRIRSSCLLPARLRAGLSALALAGFVLSQIAPSSAHALTPESPEVQQLVAKAVGFLEQPLPPEHINALFNTPPGA